MLRDLRFTVPVALIGASLSLAAMPSARAANAIVYLIPGVMDSGGAANTGRATVFHCSNVSGRTIKLTFIVRGRDGTVVGRFATNVEARRTWRASTHGAFGFGADVFLTAGEPIDAGYATIASSSPAVVCTAAVVDAAVSNPSGIALHMQRRAPFPKTLE